MSQLIYGRNTVTSSLKKGNVLKVYLKDDFSDKKILEEIKKSGLKPIIINAKELDKMVKSDKHQGIVAQIKDFSYRGLEEVINYSKKQEKPLILILDGIEDPHNFGAIIRSADAFSVDAIIIKDRNQVDVTPVVSKVSTGAIDHVRICKVSNLNNAIKTLKSNGYWIYAADGSGTSDYSKEKYDRPTVLVVGSEGFGISKLVLENSDFIISIPMTGHVNSLNVSVATGILLSRIRN